MIYNRDAIDRSGMIENMLRRKAEQSNEERRLMAERNQIWQDAISAGGRLADKMFSDEDKLRQLEAERAALEEIEPSTSAQNIPAQTIAAPSVSTSAQNTTGSQLSWLEEATRKAMEEFRREQRNGKQFIDEEKYLDQLENIGPTSRIDEEAIDRALKRAKLEGRYRAQGQEMI